MRLVFIRYAHDAHWRVSCELSRAPVLGSIANTSKSVLSSEVVYHVLIAMIFGK